VNNRINRVKRFFRWAVAEELVPPSVIHGLNAVQGLRKGRTRARETEPVLPVDDQHVDAILPFVTPHIAAMIQLQRMTGMRPGEVVSIRGDEIDVRGDVWIYQPLEHKNDYRGHLRKIPLGPKAQQLLKPFMNKETFLFSPIESEAWRNEQRRIERKTPLTPSQRKRKPKKKPKRRKRERYDTASYRRAIKYGIKRLNRIREQQEQPLIPNWYPLQLRHSRATELNELYGIEAAAVSLGHAHADVTKIYAERNLKLAMDVAKKTG
jgi:integrase